jgi:hypothetical protein
MSLKNIFITPGDLVMCLSTGLQYTYVYVALSRAVLRDLA